MPTEKEQAFAETMSILKGIQDKVNELEQTRQLRENALWRDYQEQIKLDKTVVSAKQDIEQWTQLLNQTSVELFPIGSVFSTTDGEIVYYVIRTNTRFDRIDCAVIKPIVSGRRNSKYGGYLQMSKAYAPVPNIDTIPDKKVKAKVRAEVAKLRLNILSGD